MANDFYGILHQLAAQINQQEKVIRELRKNQINLKKELEELKNQPPITVERIEYSFDQLKIERLEGTLNIGLNPNDLQNLDEFQVNQLPFQQMQDQYLLQLIKRIEQELTEYLESDFLHLVDETKHELGLQLDDSYTEFIKQDIQKQLRSRIEFYLQHFLRDSQPGDPPDEQQIKTQIKEDIHKAVHSFFIQFPMKGERGKDDSGSDQ